MVGNLFSAIRVMVLVGVWDGIVERVIVVYSDNSTVRTRGLVRRIVGNSISYRFICSGIGIFVNNLVPFRGLT